MKRLSTLLTLLLIAVALQMPARAQSADKIFERYRKAIGGKAAAKVRSVVMSGSLTTSDGQEGRFVYHAASPDRLRVDILLGQVQVSECYNGKSAWLRDPRGLRTLLGIESTSLRLRALIANSRLRDLSRHRIYPQPVIKTTLQGRDAYAVELLMAGVRVNLFFDAATWLLLKQERELAQGVEETSLGDYRAVDGVMEPFSLTIKRGVTEYRIALDQVQHNQTVDPTTYHYPQPEGARPLPDIESLMKAVVANQERVEELRERYTFRETETENRLDGNGRIKQSETRLYDVTPVAGSFVRRLVSVDGRELSAAEREKEDRRVLKEVEEAIKRREKRQSRLEEDGDEVTILTFLRISEVTSVRREVFRGQEVIAFDFEPRKGFKPKNRAETIVSKLAGTVWVDEAAREIARLEARLVDSFKIGGGLLASVSPSTAFVFEQEKVDGEVWLPSFAEANIAARVMLFARFNRSSTIRYSDYKKHKVDSEYKLEKPKPSQGPPMKSKVRSVGMRSAEFWGTL